MSDATEPRLSVTELDEHGLVDAIATLSEVLRRRLDLLERSETLVLSALTTLSDLVSDRLEAIERSQQALIEAVSRLEPARELRHAEVDEADLVQVVVGPNGSV